MRLPFQRLLARSAFSSGNAELIGGQVVAQRLERAAALDRRRQTLREQRRRVPGPLEPARRVRVRQLVRQHLRRPGLLAGERGAEHADVTRPAGSVAQVSRRVREEADARLARVFAEGADQLGSRGVVVDHDRLARGDAEQRQALARRTARLGQRLGAGLLALVGDHDEPVAPHRHRALKGHDPLSAHVARRHVVQQHQTAAAQGDVEDAAGHDAVGRVGSAELADRADVEAAGVAAHRLGDEAHACPRQPHQVAVQGVDRAAGVAALRGKRRLPRGKVARARAPASRASSRRRRRRPSPSGRPGASRPCPP